MHISSPPGPPLGGVNVLVVGFVEALGDELVVVVVVVCYLFGTHLVDRIKVITKYKAY